MCKEKDIKSSISNVVGNDLDWIELDGIAGIILNKHLEDEFKESPLFDVSSKKLRRLIVLGIEEGIKYSEKIKK